ncbi:hypothetical protein [Spiroplasma sp. SV19]|uniref:hypothetical protein n=1 Tax=Spiroplasma sp. SV19 TaxID=2570468 RepID=UPI0024B76F75|nr:hypothetical protein [Spiroplasma sp. SV19]WHQ36584.1 hypothetical protein E7Y35_01405 [Spiroplasma sp. SV19]
MIVFIIVWTILIVICCLIGALLLYFKNKNKNLIINNSSTIFGTLKSNLHWVFFGTAMVLFLILSWRIITSLF